MGTNYQTILRLSAKPAISNITYVGRTDYFVKRSDYWLQRSDHGTKWPDTVNPQFAQNIFNSCSVHSPSCWIGSHSTLRAKITSWKSQIDFAVAKLKLPWPNWFCRGQILIDIAVAKLILPWPNWYCRGQIDIPVTVVGHRRNLTPGYYINIQHARWVTWNILLTQKWLQKGPSRCHGCLTCITCLTWRPLTCIYWAPGF